MSENNTYFCKNLILWYLQNKREMPWRQTKDPYKIWLSEIILQQTRVKQGTPYYLAFINAYPTVHELASAQEDEVLKLWQGLGYYSRARNLHFTAKYISEHLGGVFPDTYEGLIKLKGIGDYTASAIASICFQRATAVVDGNVYRVLSRVFNISDPINSTSGIKKFKALAQSLVPSKDVGTYNQAIMEFGSLQCVPKNPKCYICVLNSKCEAYAKNTITERPVKLSKLKIKKRYFNYLVYVDRNNATSLERRTSGIWKNLYQFPLLETSNIISGDYLKKENDFLEENQLLKYNDLPIVHKLSHQHIFTTFWIINIETELPNSVLPSDIKKFAVPVLLEKFISNFSPFNE